MAEKEKGHADLKEHLIRSQRNYETFYKALYKEDPKSGLYIYKLIGKAGLLNAGKLIILK